MTFWHNLEYLPIPSWLYALMTFFTLISSVVFALMYAHGSNWRSTVQGRVFMAIVGVLISIAAVVFATFFFDDYPFRWVVRVIVYPAGGFIMVWASVVLFRGQRKSYNEFVNELTKSLGHLPFANMTDSQKESLVKRVRRQLKGGR